MSRSCIDTKIKKIIKNIKINKNWFACLATVGAVVAFLEPFMPHDLDVERRLLLKRQERDRWLLTQDSFRSSPIIAPVPTTPAPPHEGGASALRHTNPLSSVEARAPCARPRSNTEEHRLVEVVDSSEDSDASGTQGTESRAVARHWGRVWKAQAMLRRSQHAEALPLRGQLSVTAGESFFGHSTVVRERTYELDHTCTDAQRSYMYSCTAAEEGFGHKLMHATTCLPGRLDDLPRLSALNADAAAQVFAKDDCLLDKVADVAGRPFAS